MAAAGSRLGAFDKRARRGAVVKTGLMLGLGEELDEVREAAISVLCRGEAEHVVGLRAAFVACDEERAHVFRRLDLPQIQERDRAQHALFVAHGGEPLLEALVGEEAPEIDDRLLRAVRLRGRVEPHRDRDRQCARSTARASRRRQPAQRVDGLA